MKISSKILIGIALLYSTISQAIINGIELELEEDERLESFTVFLRAWHHGPTFNIPERCGSTLIGDRYLLTAGHCIYDKFFIANHDEDGNPKKPIKVLLSSEEITLCDSPLTCYEDRKNEKFKIHRVVEPPEPYLPISPYINDIALIILEKPVTNIPITLINQQAVLKNGKTLMALGWGLKNLTHASDNLLKGFMAYQDIDKDNLPDYLQRDPHYLKNLQRKKFLLNGTLFDQMPCRGDSGGPVLDEEDGIRQVGVISSKGSKLLLSGVEENTQFPLFRINQCTPATDIATITDLRSDLYRNWISLYMSAFSPHYGIPPVHRICIKDETDYQQFPHAPQPITEVASAFEANKHWQLHPDSSIHCITVDDFSGIQPDHLLVSITPTFFDKQGNQQAMLSTIDCRKVIHSMNNFDSTKFFASYNPWAKKEEGCGYVLMASNNNLNHNISLLLRYHLSQTRDQESYKVMWEYRLSTKKRSKSAVDQARVEFDDPETYPFYLMGSVVYSEGEQPVERIEWQNDRHYDRDEL